jgi:hypothetical protein
LGFLYAFDRRSFAILALITLAATALAGCHAPLGDDQIILAFPMRDTDLNPDKDPQHLASWVTAQTGIPTRIYFLTGEHSAIEALRSASADVIVGLGGGSSQVTGLVRAFGWQLYPVPFFFKVVHGPRFLLEEDPAGLLFVREPLYEDADPFAAVLRMVGEKALEGEFYDRYRGVRGRLFSVIRLNNPDFPGSPSELLGLTQALLDRFIFAFYCEDMGEVRGSVQGSTKSNSAAVGVTSNSRRTEVPSGASSSHWMTSASRTSVSFGSPA